MKTKKERKAEKQKRLRNKKLCKRYPFLVPRNVFTDKLVRDYKYEFTEYDCLLSGWQKAFGKMLLEELRDACIKNNYLDKLRILQWKEKYGSMRLYTNAAPQEVHDIVNKYEFISGFACCYCGSPHAQIVSERGWYTAICKNCYEKHNAKAVKRGWTDIPWTEVYDDTIPMEIPKEIKWTKFAPHNGTETVVIDIGETVEEIEGRWCRC